MKKFYLSFVFISHIVCASQTTDILVKYQQDVAQLQQKVKSKSLQELRQAMNDAYKKREECEEHILQRNNDIALTQRQLINLQSIASSQHNRYQEEYQRPFDPQRSMQVAQAALARYEKLSYEDQNKQAQASVLKGVVCTPEGIKQYWSRQINGDFSAAQGLFFQSKQQNLGQISHENSQSQQQMQQIFTNQNIFGQELHGLYSYAGAYDVLQKQFLQLFNDNTAIKVTDTVRRVAAQHKVERMRQVKQENVDKQRTSAALTLQCWARGLQPQEQLRLHKVQKLQNKSAVQVQSATRGFLARRQTNKLRQERDEQLRLQKVEQARLFTEQRAREEEEQIRLKESSFAKATADKEALRLEQSQRDKAAHAEKIEQEKQAKDKEQADKKAKVDAHREVVKARVQAARLAAEQKEAKDKEEREWLATQVEKVNSQAVQQVAVHKTKEDEQLGQKIAGRYQEFLRLKSTSQDLKFLKNELDKYDRKHNIFQDATVSSRQLMFAVKGLLTMSIEDNALWLHNIVSEIHYLDKCLRDHSESVLRNESVDRSFVLENELHAHLAALVSQFHNDCLGLTTAEINQRHIQLSNESMYIQQRLQNCIGSHIVDRKTIQEAMAAENKKFADLTIELEKTMNLFEKSTIRDKLVLLQSIIASKPDFMNTGVLRTSDVERIRQDIKKVILAKGKSFKPTDIQELIQNLGIQIGLTQVDQQAVSIGLVQLSLDHSFITTPDLLTLPFQKNAFERKLIQMNLEGRVFTPAIAADIVKIQYLMTAVFLEHKDILKKR